MIAKNSASAFPHASGVSMTEHAVRSWLKLSLTLLTLQMAPANVVAQTPDSLSPFIEFAVHDVGRHRWFVSNAGDAGGGLAQIGSLWIGAIVGRDTLVSVSSDGWSFGGELLPSSELFQDRNDERLKIHRLSDVPGGDFLNAKSEMDVITVYYDSGSAEFADPFDGKINRPLDVKITQRSYSWGVDIAEDFLLVDYSITNVGLKTLRKVYVGFFFDGADGSDIIRGDVHGFLKKATRYLSDGASCEFTRDINIPWYADVDGGILNPVTGIFDSTARNSVFSVVILNPAEDSKSHAFNWWLTDGNRSGDFGPRKVGTRERPFRDFGGILGTPVGERNKYSQMSNGEVDYDQLTTAIDHTIDGWLEPPLDAFDIADGRFDTHALASTGPFELRPGQTLPFTIALVMADNFHRFPSNFNENFEPFDQTAFYENLDFSDLVKNVTWAEWVYDNPGIDTDGDGFKGQFVTCPTESGAIISTTLVVDTTQSPAESTLVIDTTFGVISADTFWLTGDGIPDFTAVTPPETPDVTFTPANSRISLEWNGIRSETVADRFTGDHDFEGYRVYWGLARTREDLHIASSYDIEDYAQWVFNKDTAVIFSDGFWEVVRKPFSLREAQIAYARGSTDWSPLIHGIDNPLTVGDSAFYFTTQDWNQSDLRDTTQIHKIYPDEPFPHTLILDSAFRNDELYTDPLTGATVFYQGGELTPDGKRFKYFEYRFIFDEILASQVYYVSVTAFDYGITGSNLGFLESSRVLTAVEALAQNRVDPSLPGGLQVIVYPNPYRFDGNYRVDGFEGRGREEFSDERVRAVHFTGLPPVCKISVYSLDGDLIREIEHDKPADDPSAMHDAWDLISRNLLPVVSGIYYYIVETPSGESQIGKIVLIM